MNAVILAGGFGSRLSPITDRVPKPMVKVNNVPMLDYIVSHLSGVGINNFVFTLGYKPEQIIEHAVRYKQAKCRFSIESEPLGTLGGVKINQKLLDDTFIVFSGDALEDINLYALINKHVSSSALVTMAVTPVEDTYKYGICELDGYGNVVSYDEKPPLGKEKTNLANCGIYVISKKVLSLVPSDINLDFSNDLFPTLVKNGQLNAYIHDGYWCDIGSIKDYYLANFYAKDNDFFSGLNKINSSGMRAKVSGQVVSSSICGGGGIVGRVNNSIVGSGSSVASGSSIDSCVVLDNVVVKGSYNNCIIGQEFILDLTDVIKANANIQNITKTYDNVFKTI